MVDMAEPRPRGQAERHRRHHHPRQHSTQQEHNALGSDRAWCECARNPNLQRDEYVGRRILLHLHLSDDYDCLQSMGGALTLFNRQIESISCSLMLYQKLSQSR